MKIKDIRKLKGDEIPKKMAELSMELIKLQGQSATGTPPKSPGQIRQIKQMIAKIKTIQREAELASMSREEMPAQEKNKEVK